VDSTVMPLILQLGGGAGIALLLKSLFEVLVAIRSGASVREGKRNSQIIQQRDAAILRVEEQRERADAADRRADEEKARADWAENNQHIERSNSQRAREHAAELRVSLMEKAGLSRAELPTWPTMENPIPRSELFRRIEEKRKESEQ
jgi:hypothetical protein